MLGEIIHYNEERAYGFIEVENDTNQYFFHISNLIDKNIKIDLNQKVEFESIYTDKGFVARDIQIIQQIECPICKTLNSETNKNCTNTKCEWDLTYVKVGSFIGLSQNEIEVYNQKLQKTKNVYNKTYEVRKILPKIILKKKTKFVQVKIKKFGYLILDELTKNQFENDIEYKNRIDDLDYKIIGNTKFNKYLREEEYFEIQCFIDSNFIKHIKYAKNYNTKVYIPVKIAKEIYHDHKKYNLFGRVQVINNEVTLVDICVEGYSFKETIEEEKEVIKQNKISQLYEEYYKLKKEKKELEDKDSIIDSCLDLAGAGITY